MTNNTPDMLYNRALAQLNVYLAVLRSLGPDDHTTRWTEGDLVDLMNEVGKVDRAKYWELHSRKFEGKVKAMRDNPELWSAYKVYS